MNKGVVSWTSLIASLMSGVVAEFIPVFADEPLIIRTSIEPSDDIVVGQRVLYQLDVLSAEGWASVSKIPRIETAGAIAYTPRSQSIRLNETIDGESYSGQRYEIWVYPQRTGVLKLPTLNVNVNVRTFGINGEKTTKRLKTNPIEFEVGLPAGVSEGTNLVCTGDLKVEQIWIPEQLTAVIGDGFERIIKRTIADSPGMVLRPLGTGDIDGIRVYPKQPQIDDSINRGELIGRRTDSLTYVFERPGEYELPELVFQWWDNDAMQLREEVLSGLTVEVRPSAEITRVVDAPVPTKSETRLAIPLTILLFVFGLSYLCWRNRILLSEAWRQALYRHQSSEKSHFRRFVRAVGSNDAKATYRLLMRWLDCLEHPVQPARLDRFLAEYGDRAAIQAAEEMILAAQTSTMAQWRGGQLLEGMRKARKSYQLSVSLSAANRFRLPEINPQVLPKR